MPEKWYWKDRLRVESFHRPGDIALGRVKVDAEKCTGCGICAAICPSKCLEVVDKKCRMTEALPLCVACGDCSAICPEQALSQEAFIEFRRHFKHLDRGVPAWPRKF